MKTLVCALFVFLIVHICAAKSSVETLKILRPHGVGVVNVTPKVELSFPIAADGREKAEIDFGDFVKRDAAWKQGDEAVVRIDAQFGFENVWFRDWLHFSVTVFVGDGTFELPFKAKGTITAGRKGLRNDNTVFMERLAAAVAPAFLKAADYLRSGNEANQYRASQPTPGS